MFATHHLSTKDKTNYLSCYLDRQFQSTSHDNNVSFMYINTDCLFRNSLRSRLVVRFFAYNENPADEVDFFY